MIIILISSFISLFASIFLTKKFIKFFKSINLVARDLHKAKKPILPTSGGIPVCFAILAGLLTYIGIKTFLYFNLTEIIPLLAIVSSILLVTFIGLFDDLHKPLEKSRYEIKRIEKKFGKIKAGLPQSKWVLTLPAAIPLMVINAGETTLNLPIFGAIDFGIFYPLVLIPIGFVGAANLINLLGGFNGSEAGMGIVYLFSLAIFASLSKNFVSILFFVSAFALIGFLIYNWYPAKILPGDSLTYLLGAIVASGVIIGNMEKAGIILLAPFILEFLLKARSKFKASCLGILKKKWKTKSSLWKKNLFANPHFNEFERNE